MALKEMTPVIECEREALEFDSLPDFIREHQVPTRESTVSMPSRNFSEHALVPVASDSEAPKSDELEALWPGVHHDFEHNQRKQPSFYMTVGFMAGAVISLIGVFGYSTVSNVVASKATNEKPTLVADATVPKASGAPQTLTGQDGAEILVPASNSYEVQPGDTLAGIAMHNYKRVSPRLLDAIVRANGMRNANVLNLGQKINLPEYRPQAAQIANTATIQ